MGFPLYLIFGENRLSHPLCLSCMLAVQTSGPLSIFTSMMGIVEKPSVMSWMPAAVAIFHWSPWMRLSKSSLVTSLWRNLPSVWTAEVWNAYVWFPTLDSPNVFAALHTYFQAMKQVILMNFSVHFRSMQGRVKACMWFVLSKPPSNSHG